MANEQDEIREKVINGIAALLWINDFTFEYKVVKKPKGIRVICEVTQGQVDAMMKEMTKQQPE